MQTYQQKEQRWNFIKSVGTVTGIAAAYLGRRQIARGALRAVESATAHYAPLSRASSRFAVSTFASEVRNLTEEQLARQAIQKIGESRMREILTTRHGLAGDIVDDLFRGQSRSSTWTSHRLDNVDELLRSRAYRDAVNRSNMSVDKMARILEDARVKSDISTLEGLYHRERLPDGSLGGRTFGSKSRNKAYAQSAADIQAQVNQAQRETEAAFIEKLREMAKPAGSRKGRGRRSLLRFSGMKEATLGDTTSGGLGLAQDAVDRLDSDRHYLNDLLKRHGVSDFDVDSVRVGGLWKSGNSVYDLRGAAGLGKRALNYARNNFQIPLIPYVSGFNPLNMFPWLTSDAGKDVAYVGYKSIANQVAIGDLVKDKEIGVAVIRGTAIGYDFREGAQTAAVRLAENIGVHDSSTGFARRMLESFHSYNTRDTSGPDSFAAKLKNLFSIGNQPQDSNIARMRSVFAKRNADDYAATAVQRLYDGTNASNTEALEKNVQSVYSFLKNEGNITPEAMRVLRQPGMFTGTPMEDAVRYFESDAAIAEFFAKSDDYQAHSTRLRTLLEQFSRDPDSVLSMTRSHRDRGMIEGVNILGTPEPKYGIDLMREAISEEMVLRYASPTEAGNFTPIADLVERSTLTAAQKQNALSFIHGTQIEREFELNGIEAARDLITSSSISDRVRKNAEYMVNDRLSVFDTHLPLPEDSDIPNLMLMREHHSVIGEINDSIKRHGSDVRSIIGDVTGSNALKQYTTGFSQGVKDPSHFTSSSGIMYFFSERLNTAVSDWGLGLSAKDLGSGGDILKGLILKRALPGFVGYEAWNYLNYESEELTGTSPKEALANVKANMRLMRARLLGNEHGDELYPGLDRYTSFRSYEEEQEQLRYGYEPIRSGRWWLFGSRTQFTGDKIKYFLPDSYQRAHSNWEAADNADLNSSDYWANSALPSLRYPLAPIRHFLTNPYWWENKHSVGGYADRPYVRSGPLFSNETPWGPGLNATLGELLKPQRSLHPEYDPRYGGFGGYAAMDEGVVSNVVSDTVGGGYLGEGSESVGYALHSAEELDAVSFRLHNRALANVMPAGGVDVTSRRPGAAGKGAPGRPKTRTRLLDNYKPERGGLGATDIEERSLISEGVASVRELTGIYGWFGETLLTDRPTGVEMDDASHATGFSSRFYNANLGGLGGVVNEIGRRFLRRRPGTIEYYNPVPNAFSDTWLPDNNYFINFERGDPYTNVENGLLRLPGEAYERVHGVKLLQTRASSLGKTENELILSMINEKSALSKRGEEVTEWGNEYHSEMQTYLQALGIQYAAETEVYDAKLGISGHIDTVLKGRDIFGRVHPVIGEIKTMSNKRFRQNKPYDSHLDQLNFYMHSSGYHKGALIYINRDNPEEFKVHNVDYSWLRHRRTLAKLERARTRVKQMVDEGLVSRAQLYDNVTRFEILSDTAPYSDEWFELKESLSDDDQITEAERSRYKAAKQRASLQKKRYEFAPYKFTTADLEKESYTVDRVIDANTILTREGEVVKLAGVRASTSRAEGKLDDKSLYQRYVTDPIKGFVYGEYRDNVEAPFIEALTSTWDNYLSPWGNLEVAEDDGVFEATLKQWANENLLFTPKWFSNKLTGFRSNAKSLLNGLFKDDRPTAERMYSQYGIEEGARFDLLVSTDPDDQTGSDMYGARRGVIVKDGTNVNRALLKREIAEETNDTSAAGVLARFSATEKLKGGLWERFAHLDTPLHTKFLRVRSPYEQYVRGNVYGKDTGTWDNPYRDYIAPTFESYIVRNPLIAGVSLGLFSSMFGATKSMKLKLGKYGALVGAGASLLTHGRELLSGEEWIPKRTRKRREIEEYYDILKYVKYRSLYEYAAKRAKEEEDVDVAELLESHREKGEARKGYARKLTDLKAELKLYGEDAELDDRLAETYDKVKSKRSSEIQEYINNSIKEGRGKQKPGTDAKAMLKAINAEIKDVSSKKRYEKTGPWATQAILYKRMYETTMFGLSQKDGGANFRDIIAALPKYEREVLSAAIQDSTPAERNKLYRLLPDYQKRLLASHLGQESAPSTVNLNDYFKTHTLPGADWKGWSPNVNLNDLKTRTIGYENLDPMDFGIYPQQMHHAEQITTSVDVPTVTGSSNDIKNTLLDILSGSGLKKPKVLVQVIEDHHAERDTVDVDMQIAHDRHKDLVNALRSQ